MAVLHLAALVGLVVPTESRLRMSVALVGLMVAAQVAQAARQGLVLLAVSAPSASSGASVEATRLTQEMYDVYQSDF